MRSSPSREFPVVEPAGSGSGEGGAYPAFIHQFEITEAQLIPHGEGPASHDAMRALAASGITRGCTEDRFCPADPVLRGQMASFLMRGLELIVGQDPPVFVDVPDEHPHREGIEALAEAEITLGCAPEHFCPDAVVTREQMASFLVRALDL